ncbi:glucoside xylosyltransferase 1 isoform X3 [Vanacampus margaritifer]
MRCYLRAWLLCMAIFSSLYVFNHLAHTLEETNGRDLGELETPEGGSRDTGNDFKNRTVLAGGRVRKPVRCNSLSVSYWNPFWRLPADVCGLNCFVESSSRDRMDSEAEDGGDESIHLAVAACGPKLDETLLKSAILFSKKLIKFHIFADDELQGSFQNALHSWPSSIQTKFNFIIYHITYPSVNEKEWKKLFKLCATQRLFLPLILKEVDSLLYVDTDILFLQPVEDIWAFFSQFNASQLAAMALETEDLRIGWYNRFARHPYYGSAGINSGVLLMNMTRIRETFFKKASTCCPASGTTVRTTASTATTVSRLRKMASPSSTVAGEFTMTKISRSLEPSMRPSDSTPLATTWRPHCFNLWKHLSGPPPIPTADG